MSFGTGNITITKTLEIEKNLKPCPFCGEPALLIRRQKNLYDIGCNTAGCFLEYGADLAIDIIELVKMWNNRQPCA